MDLIAIVGDVLDGLRVELIAHGGDVKVAAVDDDTVLLVVSGPAAGRCADKRAIVQHAEKLLRATFPWIEKVETVCPESGPEAL